MLLTQRPRGGIEVQAVARLGASEALKLAADSRETRDVFAARATNQWESPGR